MPLTIGDRDITDIRYGDRLIEQVFAGPVEVWRRLHRWEQAGVSKTLDVPTWARYVDFVALGGGSGGSGGNALNSDGKGGRPGSWAFTMLSVVAGEQLGLSIGQGGAAERSGGATTVTRSGRTVLVAAGGVTWGGSSYGDPTGIGAPDFTPLGGFSGGGNVGKDTVGSWPGGGGGGGDGWFGGYRAGAAGGAGVVWYRFRSY